MSKVIDNNDIWYHEVAPRSYYLEEDLERSIIQNLEIIFPEYKAFLFKKTLIDSTNPSKQNRPDLAMVKNDYSEWYIIEVELGKHQRSHVVDQLRTFYNSSYNDDHANYMFDQRPDMNLVQLKKMVAANPPELMVIVNEPKPDWEIDLKAFKCKACIFQIYHDFDGNTIHRLNGDHPHIKIDFCHCRYQKPAPYTIEILDNLGMLDSHGIINGTTFDIEFNGRIFRWTRQDSTSGRIFLQSKNPRPPLDPLRTSYRLNYNQSVIKSQQKGGIFLKQLYKWGILKPKPSTLISFNFTKD
jgi:hypothetical protein